MSFVLLIYFGKYFSKHFSHSFIKKWNIINEIFYEIEQLNYDRENIRLRNSINHCNRSDEMYGKIWNKLLTWLNFSISYSIIDIGPVRLVKFHDVNYSNELFISEALNQKVFHKPSWYKIWIKLFKKPCNRAARHFRTKMFEFSQSFIVGQMFREHNEKLIFNSINCWQQLKIRVHDEAVVWV